MGKYKAREIKNLSDFVKEKGDNIHKLKQVNSVNGNIWEVGKIIMGPKYKPAERRQCMSQLHSTYLQMRQKVNIKIQCGSTYEKHGTATES